jgi:hypothetical protein
MRPDLVVLEADPLSGLPNTRRDICDVSRSAKFPVIRLGDVVNGYSVFRIIKIGEGF